MRVALLNAHTSYSPGVARAVYGKVYTEYQISCKVNKLLLKYLEDRDIDTVIIDGSEILPYNNSLYYKATVVNDSFANVAIETHLNGFIVPEDAQGMEICYHGEYNNSKDLAACIMENMVEYLPFLVRRRSGMYPRSKIYLLKHILCPSVIVELFFLTHPTDCLYLLHPRGLDIVANALGGGIVNYLNYH